MGDYRMSADEAVALDNLMPGNQNILLGTRLKSILDVVYGLGAGDVINFSGVVPQNADTDGSMISTGSTWIIHSVAGACAMKVLAGSSATSGDYATLRMRARSDGVNTAGGVVCGNFSASANVDNYANLYAVQGYAQPNAKTQNNAANILCGVYSCVDRTAATSGRSWSLWTDTHETVKASAGHYLHRLSHNGGAINLDGIWTIYAGQGCNYLMNFENVNAPVSAGDATGGSKSYKIAVNVAGTPGYIQWYAA
jgi:hypothetical protein